MHQTKMMMNKIRKNFEKDLGNLLSNYKNRDERFLESELTIHYSPKSDDLNISFKNIGVSKILDIESILEMYLDVKYGNVDINSRDQFDKYVVTGLMVLIERIFSDSIFEIRTPLVFCESMLILLEKDLVENDVSYKHEYLEEAISKLKSTISYVNKRKNQIENGNYYSNQVDLEKLREELEGLKYTISKRLEPPS